MVANLVMSLLKASGRHAAWNVGRRMCSALSISVSIHGNSHGEKDKNDKDEERLV